MSNTTAADNGTEERLGTLWAARLDEAAAGLSPDIAERLRFSRERALARSRAARAQVAAARPGMAWSGAAWAGASVAVGGAGAAMGLGPQARAGGLVGSLAGIPGAAGLSGARGPGGPGLGWAGRIISLLPLAILFVGLLTIQSLMREWQIEAAAEVDAALLADDLPPQAYSDPGFAEFLRREGR